MAARQEPHQDQRPSQGRLPPSHRKARPAPSSGRARGLSSGGPQTLPTSRGRCLGTTWRRASRHVSLRRTQGKECPPLRSSSPRPLRNCKKQEPCAATDAHKARLTIQARVLSCASASTSQGSTGPHLRSASGLRVRAAVRAHPTATFNALRLAERGVSPLAQHAACPGGSGGQVPRRPGGDGDGQIGRASCRERV